jgi:hypothetical protein
MEKWNKYEKIEPKTQDYPIVLVSKKVQKTRTVFNINVVISEELIHLSKKRGYVFTKWKTLIGYDD